MTKNQVSKIMSAIESAEIKNFLVIDDITTKIYNSENAIVKADLANEMFIGIKPNLTGGSHRRFDSKIEVICMDFTDAHEFVVGADHQKIIDFVEQLGVTLTDEDKNLLIEIDNQNYNLIPPTGDYNRFVPLTEEQYNRLSPEEKSEYDAKKQAYDEEERKYIGQNMAARIVL